MYHILLSYIMYDNNARITNIFREFYLILEGFLVKFVYTEQLVNNFRKLV